MSERIRRNEAAYTNPGTMSGVICCLCICATIGFVVYFLAGRNNEPARRLWSPVVVDPKGDATILGDTRQMEFWTPSLQTKDYLPKTGGDVAASDKWQVIPDNDALVQFGSMLHSNKDVLGFRRVEVWGYGRTTYKPGWWWTINVLTNCSATDLAHTYEGFWKSHQAVFIEVIDNRGRDD